MIPSHIFRQYDIRGTYGESLTEEAARAIGWAFGLLCKERTGTDHPDIAVGRDSRSHGPALQNAVFQGLARAKCGIIDLGLVPTPLVYYAAHKLEPQGFIMVTGSHNPPGENGFKLGVGKSTMHSEDIALLGRMAQNAPADGWDHIRPAVPVQDVITRYQQEMAERFAHLTPLQKKIGRPVRVVADAGNGTAGIVFPTILRKLGFEAVELFSEPDGRFPNHHPDPTLPEALALLRAEMAAKGADCGLSFDGDADRLGVLDEKGAVIWGDMLLLVLSRALIAERNAAGGKTPLVISEVKASQVLYDGVVKAGGKALMWKTGHSLIKAKMRETGAEIAGEMSGHLFFADRWYGFDDAMYASLRVLEVYVKALAEKNVTAFSGLLADVPRAVNTPEIRFPCAEEKKFALVEAVARRMVEHKASGRPPAIRDIIDIDGVRLVFADGWGLLRASNTQPVLVMRFEAATEGKMKEYERFVRGVLEAENE
jgi:phosphomannomutase / phosphoglucomutase